MLKFWSMFLYGYGQHNSNPWWCQYSPKPLSNMRLLHHSFHYFEFSSVFGSRKSPNNATALQEATTSPFIPSRRPKASWRAQMLPHSAHRTTLPKRPWVTISTAHWRRVEKAGGVQKGKVTHEHAVYLPLSSRTTQGYSVSQKSHSGVFSLGSVTSHWAISGNNSFFIGEVIWLQTPLPHFESEMQRQHDSIITLSAQHEIKWPPFMLRNVSGLIVWDSVHKTFQK